MTRANLQLTDYDVDGRPLAGDLAILSAPLTEVVTSELDGASAALNVTPVEVLLAALGRAIERTIGDGVVKVDVDAPGLGLRPISLTCAAPRDITASELLSGVHHAVAASPEFRAVHGAELHGLAAADVLLALDGGPADSARMGHSLELHAHRRGAVMVLDWWFDARSFEAYTIEELAEQFPMALIELTSEASAPFVTAAELAMAF